MPFQPGHEEYVAVDDSAGTLRNISAYCHECTLARSFDELDTTTFGQTAHRRIGGLSDGSFSISGKWDPAATTGPDVVLNGALGRVGSVEYGPQGNTSGEVKYSAEALCTTYEISATVDGLVEFSAEFALDGAVTRGTF